MASLKNKIISNTLINASSQVIMGLIGFFLLPYTINTLGAGNYGLIVMLCVLSAGGYLGLLDLGINASVVKFVSEYHAKNDTEKVSHVFIGSFLILLFIGIITCIVGLLSRGLLLENILNFPQEHLSDGLKGLGLIFICHVFQFPLFAITGFLEGLQKYKVIKTSMIIAAFINAGLTVWVLQYHPYFLNLIYVICFQSLVNFLFLIGYIIINQNYIFSYFKSFKFTQIIPIFHLSKYVFVGRLSGLFYSETDRWVLSIMGYPALLASFDLIMKPVRAVKTFNGFLGTAILPAASAMNSTNDLSKIRKLYLYGMRLNIIFVLPVISLLGIYAKEFIEYWAGKDFSYLSSSLQILLIWAALVAFSSFSGTLLLGLGYKIKQLSYISWLIALFKVGLLVALIKNYEIKGLAVAQSLSFAFFVPFLWKIYLEGISYDIKSLIQKTILPLFVSLIFGVIVFVSHKIFIPQNLFQIFLTGVLWCSLYWACSYCFVLSSEEKSVVDLAISKIFRVRPLK